MKLSKIVIILLAAIALAAGIGAGYFHKRKNSLDAVQSSTILTPPQDISAFSLMDTKGRPFNNNSLWGHWTFMFFGFTACSQVCPPTMNNLNQMYQILLKQQQNPMPQVTLISIDPAHDTLEKLGAYVQSFNPHFQGATGDQKEIDNLSSSLSILSIKSKDQKTGEETIDHSGAILLINPAGKLTAIFSMPHDPQALAKDFQVIVANSG
jgi:protein SCO1/2